MTSADPPDITLPHLPQTSPAEPGSAAYRANQALIEALIATGQRAAHAHSAYLEVSRSSQQNMASALAPMQTSLVPHPPAIFTRADLEEFASRSISRCFGPEYQVFEGRRYPRIPNGALLLMDRVTAISGKRHALVKGASITTEFDVSPSAWFYANNGYAQLPPYAVLMEMALQPCGLLSAYLGSSFPLKDVELFFRNLDGHAQVLASPDLRGKTVTGQAELLSSTLSGTTIIQKYGFSLACEGQKFYSGESVFGYFSAAGMATQVGLDTGQATLPPPYPVISLPSNALRLPLDRSVGGPLGLLDELILLPTGGQEGLAQIVARQKINPQDWFYKCHFHQDAVMPGSLGVEAALQAMTLFSAPAAAHPCAVLTFPSGNRFAWKYRGQILPVQHEMSLLVDVIGRETLPNQETLTANASIWVDNTRIYELNHLALTLSRSI
jgi:3-hydroxymyristoyl/3-hydroxydecanoyl-(acyl carrier protein) dehydratase